MKLRTKPELVDAISFGDLMSGSREPWVSSAIMLGQIWQQGGDDPYWTISTRTGTIQLRGCCWLVRLPDGALQVYTNEELWATFEYHDPEVSGQ